jgi:hypothetical protein
MLTWNDHNNSRDLRVSDRFSRDLRVSDKCDEYKLVVTCGCRTNNNNNGITKRCGLLMEKQNFCGEEYQLIGL